MTKTLILALMLMLALAGCRGGADAESKARADTEAITEPVDQLRAAAREYTEAVFGETASCEPIRAAGTPPAPLAIVVGHEGWFCETVASDIGDPTPDGADCIVWLLPDGSVQPACFHQSRSNAGRYEN